MGGMVLIFTGAPIWVWPLLVLLVFLGLRATRKRTTMRLPIYFLPLLAILSINAINGLPAANNVWIFFGLAYLVGAMSGFIFQRRIVLDQIENRVTLAGEWVTLLLLMTVFWMNFVGGVLQAVAPDAYGAPVFHMIFATIAGVVSGAFLGRAIRVLIGK